jgi:hypothetical protein
MIVMPGHLWNSTYNYGAVRDDRHHLRSLLWSFRSPVTVQPKKGRKAAPLVFVLSCPLFSNGEKICLRIEARTLKKLARFHVAGIRITLIRGNVEMGLVRVKMLGTCH